MLLDIYKSEEISVYKINETENQNTLINKYIVSTKQTREICNDSRICGYEFSKSLENVSANILKVMPYFSNLDFVETDSAVLNVMRAGLCFELRKALADVNEWNQHSSIFICPQNLSTDDNIHIIEKIHKDYDLPQECSLFIGDIIATGESLYKALELIVNEANEHKCQIKNIVLITFGSINAEIIISKIAEQCYNLFDAFKGVEIFYIEGRFEISENELINIDEEEIVHVEKELVRKASLLAPEFIQSQYEMPYYPIERYIIYDAGDRAYDSKKYIKDMILYWQKTKDLASEGISYEQLIKERFPDIIPDKFGKQNLLSLCEQHIIKLRRMLEKKVETT